MSATAGEAAAEALERIARALARKNKLVCDDGTIVCWECGQREALLPQLHCGVCLDIAKRRLGHYDSAVINRAQTDEDRAAMLAGK